MPLQPIPQYYNNVMKNMIYDARIPLGINGLFVFYVSFSFVTLGTIVLSSCDVHRFMYLYLKLRFPRCHRSCVVFEVGVLA